MMCKQKLLFLSLVFFIIISMTHWCEARTFPRGSHQVMIANTVGIRSDLLKHIAPVIEKSIASGQYAGAVVLAAHHGKTIYRGIFGNRRIVPDIVPMQFNTIFDIASLTKVVATTPAIMQLVEQGQLSLDEPAAKYWKNFIGYNKEKITIRELLTHTSGLPSTLTIKNNMQIVDQINQLQPTHSPGTAYLYSDLNFVILAYVIEAVTGEPFAYFVEKHIFQPLNMRHTFFLPPKYLINRIAPTEVINDVIRWGEVHDPIAHAIGGISGNAGLFSTAEDLAQYAQCLLNRGRIKNKKYLLGPLTILKMITPQTPLHLSEQRGLGWDIDSTFSARGILSSTSSFGHTGWTGTSLWIDPDTSTWLIILTSRTHPFPMDKNQVVEDRRLIQNIISASLTDVSTELINTSTTEILRAYKTGNIP